MENESPPSGMGVPVGGLDNSLEVSFTSSIPPLGRPPNNNRSLSSHALLEIERAAKLAYRHFSKIPEDEIRTSLPAGGQEIMNSHSPASAPATDPTLDKIPDELRGGNDAG
jgi:hypothetical protein